MQSLMISQEDTKHRFSCSEAHWGVTFQRNLFRHGRLRGISPYNGGVCQRRRRHSRDPRPYGNVCRGGLGKYSDCNIWFRGKGEGERQRRGNDRSEFQAHPGCSFGRREILWLIYEVHELWFLWSWVDGWNHDAKSCRINHAIHDESCKISHAKSRKIHAKSCKVTEGACE